MGGGGGGVTDLWTHHFHIDAECKNVYLIMPSKHEVIGLPS